MKKAVIVGAGAGGATLARELQGRFEVTLIEAGGAFKPFAADLDRIELIKKGGLLFDEREIQWLFPPMRIRKTRGNLVLVNGVGLGGTTTISAGNAVRQDQDLKAVGIDLDAEFAELAREIPVSSDHLKKWRPPTRESFAVCQAMGLNPIPTPKMIRQDRCANCGKCVLGCAHQAKWDSRVFLEEARAKGAKIVTGSKVQKVAIEKGRAAGVVAKRGMGSVLYPADLVFLAAGGLGTPLVLERSGLRCENRLFVDPVLCIAAPWPGARQNREMTMPFIVQREGYIVSPYFDHLSFFFNRRWPRPARDIFSLMIKLADDTRGGISSRGLDKALNSNDRARLKEAEMLCREVLHKLGIKDREIFLGTLNAGHPGGMLPLTEKESSSLHFAHLPANLYVADASLFPRSLGNPPILTIAALAKRIARLASQYS